MTVGADFHFDFSDDKPTPLDGRASAIDELFRQVKDKAKLMANNSGNLGDYVKAFFLDYYYTNFSGLGWLYDATKGEMSVDALAGDLEVGDKAIEIEKTTAAIAEMKDRLEQEPEREGYVRVAVRKIRKGNDVTGLRAMAIFPSGVDIQRAGFDESVGRVNDKPQVVYYEPQKACWSHAVDDARKAADENGGAYYLPLQNTQEAQNSLHADPKGNVEYVIDRGDDGERVKQSMDSYLWVALVRKADGENKHFVVSDFRENQ